MNLHETQFSSTIHFRNFVFYLMLVFVLFLGGLKFIEAGDRSLDDPFGVLVFLPWNDDWNYYMYPQDKAIKAMDFIEQAGIKWVRMDFTWLKVQPEKDQLLEFEHFDWLVEELRKRDISILGIVGYTPPWASTEGKWNSPPQDVDEFARYVARTVQHFRGKVDHWEIWNEPNLENYWQPQDDMRGYAKLLKASYRAAKTANPDCVILHGGIAVTSPRDFKWMYHLGLKEHFDVANFHLFVGNATPRIGEDFVQALRDIRQVMKENGDGAKPLWITEFGFAGVPQPIMDKNPLMRGNPDEVKQAQLLQETFAAAINSKLVDKVFWAFLQDTTGHFNGGVDYMGLIRSDFTAKPSFTAYQKLIESYQ